MVFHQISVHITNKPGAIGAVTHILAEKKINLLAITITSHGSEGIIHLLVDDPHEGSNLLKRAGYDSELKEVMAVLVDDKPGAADHLVQLLSTSNFNIENAYGFILESRIKAVMVMELNDIHKALQLVEEKGYQTLSKETLEEIEPFHYMKY